MKRFVLAVTILIAAPAASAADASCGGYQRCVDYFQRAMCLKYSGVPRSLPPEERAISDLLDRMTDNGCKMPERKAYGDACDAVRDMSFGEAEVQDCRALADQSGWNGDAP